MLIVDQSLRIILIFPGGVKDREQNLTVVQNKLLYEKITKI